MTLSGSSNRSPLRSWVGGSRTGGSDDRQTIITPQGHYYPGLRGVREVGTSSSPNSLEGSSSPCQSDCRQREQEERRSEGCSSAGASLEGGLSSSRQPAVPTHGSSAHAACSLVRAARTSYPRGHGGSTEDVEVGG